MWSHGFAMACNAIHQGTNLVSVLITSMACKDHGRGEGGACSEISEPLYMCSYSDIYLKDTLKSGY